MALGAAAEAAHEHRSPAPPRRPDRPARRAETPGRRFDVVICESIDRRPPHLHRHKDRHELEQAGVRLYAADEPMTLAAISPDCSPDGSNEAWRWYVTDLLERSWDDFKVHTGQGWNIGMPPYGYAADESTTRPACAPKARPNAPRPRPVRAPWSPTSSGPGH
jgi:hypothetical protein